METLFYLFEKMFSLIELGFMCNFKLKFFCDLVIRYVHIARHFYLK